MDEIMFTGVVFDTVEKELVLEGSVHNFWLKRPYFDHKEAFLNIFVTFLFENDLLVHING